MKLLKILLSISIVGLLFLAYELISFVWFYYFTYTH